MWAGDHAGARPRRTEGGYTLVEAIVVVFVTAVVAIVLTGAISSTQDADQFLQAMRTATERSQRIALEVSSLVNVSRKLMQGDDDGNAYLDALDLGGLPVAPGARLPLVAEDEILGQDSAAEPMTGNMILFVREADPALCVADGNLGKTRQIDTYRFVCIYPTQTTSTLVPLKPAAKDLVVWKSKPYASWAQINEISDATQKKNVLKDLHKRYGYRYSWNPDATVTDSFYAIDANGNIDSTPKASFTIEEDVLVSDRGRLVYARCQLARTESAGAATRTVLAADDPALWRPDGFEVKVTGAAHSRQVWMRLVIEAPQQGGHRTAVVPSTVISTCQDM